AFHQIGQHFQAFVELDPGHYVREGLAETGRLILIGRGKRVNLAPARASHPFGARRKTIRALGARMVAEVAAISALLDVEFMPLERFPPGTGFFVYMRE